MAHDHLLVHMQTECAEDLARCCQSLYVIYTPHQNRFSGFSTENNDDNWMTGQAARRFCEHLLVNMTGRLLGLALRIDHITFVWQLFRHGLRNLPQITITADDPAVERKRRNDKTFLLGELARWQPRLEAYLDEAGVDPLMAP